MAVLCTLQRAGVGVQQQNSSSSSEVTCCWRGLFVVAAATVTTPTAAAAAAVYRCAIGGQSAYIEWSLLACEAYPVQF